MISAGLPLVQALDILAQQTENKILADTTRQVVYDVESGQTLADALRKHPKAFSDLYVNMVAAGEAGGRFRPHLLRLGRVPREEDPDVRTVEGAAVYPRRGLSGGGDLGGVPAHLVVPARPDMR